MKDKLIVADVDGVLLDYDFHLTRWVIENTFHRSLPIEDHDEMSRLCVAFNQSEDFGNLSPLRDAKKYVRKLHEEHGFIFHSVTCSGEHTKRLRDRNLVAHFGLVFFGIDYCEIGGSKEDALHKYANENLYFVDDHPRHIRTGNALGYDTIWYKPAWRNLTDCYPNHLVTSWKEIYQIVTGEQ